MKINPGQLCDGDIPVSAVLTSVLVHGILASILLEEMTFQRVKMDAACDSAAIKTQVRSKGKVLIFDHNPRRGKKIKMPPPEKGRYKARSSSERVNSYLKNAVEGREL
ncbi:MAG: hypothetical protein AB8C84_03365 [Oligoflexales bacterium]